MFSRSILTAVVALAAAAPLPAQELFPLGPVPATGQVVSPYFEGWYANPDGTYTLSFGYFNRNQGEDLHLPLGAGNFITPAQFDGGQPEHFSPRRERGVFTVTIPAEFAASGQPVVWTLVSRGQTHTVPARVGVPAYELSHAPMAMGSLPPAVEVDRPGGVGRGPSGVNSQKVLTASVGQPVQLTVWARDESERDEGSLVDLGMNWFTHRGPAPVSFEDAVAPNAEAGGEASVNAVFSVPGEYVLRVRADNHRARDSSPGDQCCWTNGYIRVNVTP